MAMTCCQKCGKEFFDHGTGILCYDYQACGKRKEQLPKTKPIDINKRSAASANLVAFNSQMEAQKSILESQFLQACGWEKVKKTNVEEYAEPEIWVKDTKPFPSRLNRSAAVAKEQSLQFWQYLWLMLLGRQTTMPGVGEHHRRNSQDMSFPRT